MEVDASKLAVVGVDQRKFPGPEDKVIVLGGGMIGRRDEEAAGHSQVKFQVELRPGSGRRSAVRGPFLVAARPWTEGEEESFAVGAAAEQDFVRERGFDGGGRGVTVDAGAWMGVNCDDALSQSGFPDAAGEFDFGKLGHSLGSIQCSVFRRVGSFVKESEYGTLLSLRLLQQLLGLRIPRLEGLRSLQERRGRSEVLVLLDPEAGQFAEGARGFLGLLGGNAADGVAKTALRSRDVTGRAQGSRELELKVGVEVFLVGGIIGFLGERFGLADETRGGGGVSIAQGCDREAGGEGRALRVVEAGLLQEEPRFVGFLEFEILVREFEEVLRGTPRDA